MSLLRLSVKHGTTLDEAKRRMEAGVQQAHSMLGALIQQTTWSEDRSRVKLIGPGAEVEMWVDAQEVHVTGNVPLLGPLLGGLKGMLQHTFQQRLK